jgi:hypothetical protein
MEMALRNIGKKALRYLGIVLVIILMLLSWGCCKRYDFSRIQSLNELSDRFDRRYHTTHDTIDLLFANGLRENRDSLLAHPERLEIRNDKY